jgi:hypothetical protein
MSVTWVQSGRDPVYFQLRDIERSGCPGIQQFLYRATSAPLQCDVRIPLQQLIPGDANKWKAVS